MLRILVNEEFGYARYALDVSLTKAKLIKLWTTGAVSGPFDRSLGNLTCLTHCAPKMLKKGRYREFYEIPLLPFDVGIREVQKLHRRGAPYIRCDPGLTLYIDGKSYDHPDFIGEG